MNVPTAQEKSEQIFFAQPKEHQNKFADVNKTVPTNLLRMIAFLEQCKATDKAAGVLEKIAKDKKQPKEKKAYFTVILFCWQFVLLFVLRSLAFSARQNT